MSQEHDLQANIRIFFIKNIRELSTGESHFECDNLNTENITELNKFVHKDGSFGTHEGEGWKFGSGIGGVGGLTLLPQLIIDEQIEAICKQYDIDINQIAEELFIEFEFGEDIIDENSDEEFDPEIEAEVNEIEGDNDDGISSSGDREE